MRRVGLGAASAMLLVGTALALGAPGAASSASAGMSPASGKTVKSIVRDVGLMVPARCVVAEQARSNRSWAAYSLTTGAGCNPGDGYTVVQRSGGKRNALPIGGSSVPCSYLKSQLANAGAPKSVYRDFKAGKYCVKGE